MRFNKQELVTLATQPAHKFDKEGVLLLRERQDGFFRRAERAEKDCKRVKRAKSLRDLSCYGNSSSGSSKSSKGAKYKVSLERWCRLRGNLLFYFKTCDQWSEPLGVLVLEQCVVHIDSPSSTPPDGPFGFSLVWDGGLRQHLAARTDGERASWLKAVEAASYRNVRANFIRLQKLLETRRDHNPDLDVAMWRLRCGVILDPCELPLCEVSLACDNLLCDANGRPPNAVLLVHVYVPSDRAWVRYARTEVVERSSNPSFLVTVTFRASDALDNETRVRVTAYDVRESVSHTALPLGCALISLRSLIGSNSSIGAEVGKLRVALRSLAGTTVGFVSMSGYRLERDDHVGGSSESTPCRQPQVRGPALMHRRSHSLPPRLGCRLKLPPHVHINQLFANPFIQSYRFHSGLCGDIFVSELIAESKLCFAFPCQLLALWIQEEKELLQEVAGMGELREPWHSRQLQLLDRHLQLLHLYSQAQEHLLAHKGGFLKPSSRKQDRSLEFAPINLNLHRMWAQSDTLGKAGLYDIVTVGAFTAHSHRSKNGGLLKLVQQLKESPAKGGCQGTSKMNMARDAIQAIKQLRREVVEGMRGLVRLAAMKQTVGMLPICEDMITKTRALLSLWDSGLVEEALAFVDEYKVNAPPGPLEDDDSLEDSGSHDNGCAESGQMSLSMTRSMQLSPFRRITQQLHFELKSPDVDVLATPDSPRCTRNFWDLSHSSLKNNGGSDVVSENQFVAFPDAEDDTEQQKEADIDVGRDLNKKSSQKRVESAEDLLSRETDEAFDQLESKLGGEYVDGSADCLESVGDGLAGSADCPTSRRWFLDTRAMCSSPSANYYKPTEEPEPWDLTQLNIEASVMCLVSKVKFLCGRCSSPAVRLRSSGVVARSQSLRGQNSSHYKQAQENKNMEHTGECTNVPKVRNKFTEGLDLGTMSDWVSELRPSMRKLRAAMDGLLKTARLMHSAFRTRQDPRAAQKECNVRYRRDVCFSQALTALVSALMAKLWCQRPDPSFLLVLATFGPIAAFEGLLSLHGHELDMWGDMVVAVEDLSTVTFTLVHSSSTSPSSLSSSSNSRKNRGPNSSDRIGPTSTPLPRVMGSRAALTVLLPVPDVVLSQLPLLGTPQYAQQQSSRAPVSFKVTPVFFNIGINERATFAESLGQTAPQHQSNLDNYSRLHAYFLRYRKLKQLSDNQTQSPRRSIGLSQRALMMLFDKLHTAVHSKVSKNVEVLQLASRITVAMQGLRFTSCKSAKDRTGMSVTLEQVNTLTHGYDLAETEVQRALDCMRSEGCRRENTYKNIGIRKYAFSQLGVSSLPKQYRPPAGTYGSGET
ncbi:inositol polyphosphate-4-phosphatase type I A isoform X2 [Thrips palmi]|uniref:Inositol polyphosphate-4-phosphatase type I A isoform X2 n=1 Tax=Thrips palmi TaxID=161013 RepID=A0A6P9AAI6_THRPL|nr:inositol polyphosphate-4-phosphatase type I A isoform X2 [Thrips palmi]